VGLRPGVAQRHRLVVVVPQDERADLVGHRREQVVAFGLAELAGRDRAGEQDLDVDLVVGAVDAGRVVDEVGGDLAAGVLPTADLGVLDAAELGGARLPPSPITLARISLPLIRMASLALSPTSLFASLVALT
jgi:hypothetical protein